MVVRSVVRRSKLGELGVSKATFRAAGGLGPVGATADIPIDKKIQATVIIENTGSQSLIRTFCVDVYYADTLSDSSGDPQADLNTWFDEREASITACEFDKTLNPGDTLTLVTGGVDASNWGEGDIIDAGVVVYGIISGSYEYYDSLKITDAVRIIAPATRVEITDVSFSETE